jgi:hypothetical protein
MLGVCRADGKRRVTQVVLKPSPAGFVRQSQAQRPLIEPAGGRQIADGVGDKSDRLNHSFSATSTISNRIGFA